MSLVFCQTEVGLRFLRNQHRQSLSAVTGTSISQEGDAIATQSGSFPMTGSIRSRLKCGLAPATDPIRFGSMAGAYRPDTSEPFVRYTMSMDEVARNIAIETAAMLGPRLHQRIKTLADLGPKWDGKRAEAVKSSVLADVAETVRRLKWHIGKSFHEPSLVPTFDGFVQIEWHEGKRSLDLEAVADGWIAVGTLKHLQRENQYFEAEFERSNFDKIEKLYLWVAGTELIWPLL